MTRSRRSGEVVANADELAALIALGEGFTTEFKRAEAYSLGREICAFANATGGVILIGLTDRGEIVGGGDHNALKSKVQSVARSADPPIAIDVSSVNDVLCATVPEQHSKPYSFGNYNLTVKHPRSRAHRQCSRAPLGMRRQPIMATGSNSDRRPGAAPSYGRGLDANSDGWRGSGWHGAAAVRRWAAVPRAGCAC